jgi:Fic family protein
MLEPVQIERFHSGIHYPGEGYRYFMPEPIDRQWNWEDPRLNELLEKASVRVGELNSYAKLVPDVDQFIQLHVLKEALLSSRIEGTRTNIDEALLEEGDVPEDRRDDWREVRNYNRALDHAIDRLKELPLSSRLLAETHGHLMEGVRGSEKDPGNFRKSQNWIGGASIQDATYIPPVQQEVKHLMGDLEKFLHDGEIHVPALIRIGIAHYQFETVHPFLDGNGRIGRLMITLFLISEGILEKPLLYLSSYFERNKGMYYDKLMDVRERNDMLGWLKYFLTGVEETSREASQTLAKVLELKKECEDRIREGWGRRTQSALLLLEELFKNPLTTIGRVQNVCDLSPKAAGDLVKSFEDAGFLLETGRRGRRRVYSFERYISLFREE